MKNAIRTRKCFCVFFCCLGALASVTHVNARALYAATAAGAPGELYVLNAATGAVIQDVGPLNDASAVNHPITGLACHPFTGVLFGMTANNPTATAARLVTINPATAFVTVIGTNTSGGGAMTDIAFDPVTGILYGVGSSGGPQLYSINLTNGQATLIGDTGITATSGGGLAISSSSVFYGTPTSSRYGTYDLGDGSFTLITDPTRPVAGAYGALAFDENDVLYGLNVGAASPHASHLVTFNPTNGVVTDIGASVTALDAIAFQSYPTLRIARTNNQVKLHWPNFPGFQLEYKTNLSTGTWLTNSSVPTTVNGINFLSLPHDGFARFFRLRRP